jgi:hypothetical protein
VIADRTVVGRLTIRAADDGGIRSHAARLLGGAIAAPPGLGPSAVLCVRKQADPRPGTIRLDSTVIRPPASWEEAMTSSLEDALRGAARPARGPVASGASAVLFADEAELLACLSRDWLSGTLRSHWWWGALDAAREPERSIVTAFVDRPRVVPSALAHMASTGGAIVFVATLAAGDASAVAASVGAAFALSAVVDAAAAVDTGLPAFPASPSPLIDAAQNAAQSPWARVVPEAIAFVTQPERELLIGVALAIARAPRFVRTPSFEQAVRVWARLATSGGRSAATRRRPAAELATERRREPSGSHDDRRQPAREIARGGPAPARPHARRRPRDACTSAPPSSVASRREPPARLQAAPSESAAPAGTTSTGRADASSGSASRLSVATPDPEVVESGVPIWPDEVPVATGLGGIFYLLNVAIALGLYSDFTRPASPGIALDPWDFVALVARRLGAGDDASDDPIWPLLDRLSGRGRHTRPGDGFRPAAEWRIDPAWLSPFASDRRAWRRSTAGRRVVVDHPAGFRILDVTTRSGVGGGDVRRMLETYRPHPRMRRAASPPPRRRSRLDRWLDNVADYVRARLILAFGLRDASRLVELVFRHDAEVLVTASAIDVRLSLDDLPIAVRAAGVDRDPGWIPAAGRAVAFHYA